MPVKITCPHCNARLSLGEELYGKRLRCPRCRGAIVTAIPIKEDSPATPSLLPPPASTPPFPEADRATMVQSHPSPVKQATPAAGPPEPLTTTGARKRPVSVRLAAAVVLVAGSATLGAVLLARPRGTDPSRAGPSPVGGLISVVRNLAGGGQAREADADPPTDAVTPAGLEDEPAEQRDATQPAVPPSFDAPSFLVSGRTRQVYRVHLSGMHPSYAAKFAQGLGMIIARLPPDNPLRKAVIQAKGMQDFLDMYRSMRSKFLEAGVDTVYFLAEGDWAVESELPGYIAVRGTGATRDRLARHVEEAGHKDLAAFLRRMRPADGTPGWLVIRQGRAAPASPSTEGKRRAMLVEHAFQDSIPLRRASVGQAASGYSLDLRQTWPVTAVHLEIGAADNVIAPVVSAFVPGSANVMSLLSKAESVTNTVVLFPSPFFCQVAHAKDEQEARDLARSVAKMISQVFDRFEAANMLEELFKGVLSSAFQVRVNGKDVMLVMQVPPLLNLFTADRSQQELRDQDWTALVGLARSRATN